MINHAQKLKDNLTNLPTILNDYDADFSSFEKTLLIKRKMLKDANGEQPEAIMSASRCRNELKKVVKKVEIRKDQAESEVWEKLTRGNAYDLKAADKKALLNNDKDYRTYRAMQAEAEEVYNNYNDLVKSFEARGYALKNITELIVNSLGEYEIG